ncbi:MAG: amino acid ABC transporter substrate-binding protein [Paraglaciecola sp.]|nr:amino acid ABC transporter substrate-binding protein [Paraglaciecola sp.]NCT47488.1 amino acid ABC transporter substrate-binding protein [Paraglaciecola sp.]
MRLMTLSAAQKMLNILLLTLSLLAVTHAVAAPQVIKIWHYNFNSPILKELVTSALDATLDVYGPYTLKSSIPLEQGRVFTDLARGDDVQLVIAGVDKQRETDNLVVYYPVARGLLGFRLCLTTQDKAHAFGDINTLDDFRKARLYVGLGSHWPDRQIFEANGLQTVNTPVFTHLFAMLEKGRFDCLSRSISEIENEFELYNTSNMVIEPSVAIIYPYAQFMFISNHYPALHARLALGMEKIHQDGTYTRFFNRYFAPTLVTQHFYERKLIFLQNKELSAQDMAAINRYGVASFNY